MESSIQELPIEPEQPQEIQEEIQENSEEILEENEHLPPLGYVDICLLGRAGRRTEAVLKLEDFISSSLRDFKSWGCKTYHWSVLITVSRCSNVLVSKQGFDARNPPHNLFEPATTADRLINHSSEPTDIQWCPHRPADKFDRHLHRSASETNAFSSGILYSDAA